MADETGMEISCPDVPSDSHDPCPDTETEPTCYLLLLPLELLHHITRFIDKNDILWWKRTCQRLRDVVHCIWPEWVKSEIYWGPYVQSVERARIGLKEGLEWNVAAGCCAADGGYLATLQWARENKFSWDTYICAYAARGGHLAVLQWLRENGCPWDEKVVYYARLYRHFDVMEWAIANGCPTTVKITRQQYYDGWELPRDKNTIV